MEPGVESTAPEIKWKYYYFKTKQLLFSQILKYFFQSLFVIVFTLKYTQHEGSSEIAIFNLFEKYITLKLIFSPISYH